MDVFAISEQRYDDCIRPNGTQHTRSSISCDKFAFALANSRLLAYLSSTPNFARKTVHEALYTLQTIFVVETNAES
eukprot:SAG22_NODE_20606_length_264_cov_0.630303_1_plen_75_part_10